MCDRHGLTAASFTCFSNASRKFSEADSRFLKYILVCPASRTRLPDAISISSSVIAVPDVCRSLKDVKARNMTGEHAFKLLIMAGYEENVNGYS
jgi:hypothetical protein